MQYQPPQTITKVVRQGFRVKDKVLRPIEVITSKLE
ncbi:nucleotide exchange factor GrpE [Planktothrix sp.]